MNSTVCFSPGLRKIRLIPTRDRIGVGTEAYLNKMLAEPFESFTFSPAGASVYQLGTFGTARKELRAIKLAP